MVMRIRELRIARGLTQVQLAEMARISRSQLAMIETGSRPTNTTRLQSIAKALGVQPDQLFARDGDRADIQAIVRDLDPSDQDLVKQLALSLAARSPKAE